MDFNDYQAQIESARAREQKSSNRGLLDGVGLAAGILLSTTGIGAVIGIPMALYFGYKGLNNYKDEQSARSDVMMLRKAQEQSLKSNPQQARADAIAQTFGERGGSDKNWTKSLNGRTAGVSQGF